MSGVCLLGVDEPLSECFIDSLSRSLIFISRVICHASYHNPLLQIQAVGYSQPYARKAGLRVHVSTPPRQSAVCRWRGAAAAPTRCNTGCCLSPRSATRAQPSLLPPELPWYCCCYHVPLPPPHHHRRRQQLLFLLQTLPLLRLQPPRHTTHRNGPSSAALSSASSSGSSVGRHHHRRRTYSSCTVDGSNRTAEL